MWVAYSTFPDKLTALGCARALLEARVIACANVIEAGTSLYWWEGKVCEESEVYLLMKTTEKNYLEMEKLLKEHHPYQTPCLWAVAASQVHGPYLSWLKENLRA